MKYRLLVTLVFFCGMFLIASIAGTVKKRIEEYSSNRNTEINIASDSTPYKKLKSIDSTIRQESIDTLLQNGKTWRSSNEIHITY